MGEVIQADFGVHADVRGYFVELALSELAADPEFAHTLQWIFKIQREAQAAGVEVAWPGILKPVLDSVMRK